MRQKLIEDGDPEASYAHFCLQKFGWEPSKFLSLPVKERAFVIASIDARCAAERKKRRNSRTKQNANKAPALSDTGRELFPRW